MIIWGSGGRQVDLGLLEEAHCENCQTVRPFKLTLVYKYFHLYWVFKCVTQKKYWSACNVCNRGHELETGKVEQALEKSPIPLGHRYGLAMFGVLVLIVVIGIVAAQPA